MKKSVLFLGLVLLVAFFLVGCAGSKKDDKLTIGVTYDWLGVQRRVIERDAMTKYATELGVNLFFQSADQDEKAQIQHVENYISQGVDAIVILPHNSEACMPIVKACREAGIPLIVTDRMIAGADLDYFVGMDTSVMGHMQIDYMLKVRPEGKYALVAGAPTDPNARNWHANWLEKLKPFVDNGKITIVADEMCENWDPNVALRFMENTLTANNDQIDVAMVMNDGMATGVAQALDARGLFGKVLMTGLDGELVALQRIAAGKQTITIFVDDVSIGKAVLDTAIAAAKGEPVVTNAVIDNGFEQVPTFLVPPLTIDKDNLDREIIQPGFYTEAEIYQR